MTDTQPTTIIDQAREVLADDPKLALEGVIAVTAQLEIEYQREQNDTKLMSEITFGPNGMEAVSLAALWRVANLYSRSSMVPEHYQGQPENCLIAAQMAQRCKVDIFMFMQNSYIVHGKPGIEAKLAIAMLNTSGMITGRVRYEFTGLGPVSGVKGGKGATRECTAIVIDEETGEEIRMSLDWDTVEKEGWSTKSASKWLTITDQMFRYRSAVFLIRAHYPEVMMGMQTDDELEDIGPPSAIVTRPTVSMADLTANAAIEVSSPEQRNGDSATTESKPEKPQEAETEGKTEGKTEASKSTSAELARVIINSIAEASTADDFAAVASEIELNRKTISKGAMENIEWHVTRRQDELAAKQNENAMAK